VTAATTATPAETGGAAPRRTFLAAVPTWTIGLGLVLVHLAVTFTVRPHPRWNDGIFVLMTVEGSGGLIHELERRLVPARIEPHEARIAVELEAAHRAAGRQEAQGLESARALVVPLHEEAVDVELVEQHLGHVLVVAGGVPRRAEVAAAHVRRDAHARRPARDSLVEVADVGLVLVHGVAADLGHVLALLRVVEVREARIVELQIAAAQLAETGHLVAIGRGQVGPERIQIGIDRLVDGRAPAAEVHHARRRDRQLRDGRGRRVAHEREVVAEDRVIEPERLVDAHGRRREDDAAARVVELDRGIGGELLDTAELVDEVHVPRGAPHFAVGRHLQPDRLLHAHRRAHGVVLDRAQLVGFETPVRVVGTRLQELRWAQQTADVVGAKRRLSTPGHGLLLSPRR